MRQKMPMGEFLRKKMCAFQSAEGANYQTLRQNSHFQKTQAEGFPCSCGDISACGVCDHCHCDLGGVALKRQNRHFSG